MQLAWVSPLFFLCLETVLAPYIVDLIIRVLSSSVTVTSIKHAVTRVASSDLYHTQSHLEEGRLPRDRHYGFE